MSVNKYGSGVLKYAKGMMTEQDYIRQIASLKAHIDVLEQKYFELLHKVHEERVQRQASECMCHHGRVYNNADPTSGMWIPCRECDDGRRLQRHPSV